MTDRTQSILENPPGHTTKVFDSQGRDFYPTVNVQDGDASSVTALWTNGGYDALNTYINAGRGTTIAIGIPNSPGSPGVSYSHSLTVWGWEVDDPSDLQIYVTDSDDGLTGLVTYSLLRSGNNLTIVGYHNLYQSSTNVAHRGGAEAQPERSFDRAGPRRYERGRGARTDHSAAARRRSRRSAGPQEVQVVAGSPLRLRSRDEAVGRSRPTASWLSVDVPDRRDL